MENMGPGVPGAHVTKLVVMEKGPEQENVKSNQNVVANLVWERTIKLTNARIWNAQVSNFDTLI